MSPQSNHTSSDQQDTSDPFDDLLTLEDTLYTAAYDLGASDGAHAGRIEGRIFGLEKGFEKFTELGLLHGRSVIWASRLPNLGSSHSTCTSTMYSEEKTKDKGNIGRLPRLSKNERLRNNTTLLHSLTDPETFDTANTEEAVADFDDRLKRAGAKAKVIERIVGETSDRTTAPPDGSPAPMAASRSKTRPVRVSGQSKTGAGGSGGGAKMGDDSMEDFAGSRLLR